jgi:hypothetical protein
MGFRRQEVTVNFFIGKLECELVSAVNGLEPAADKSLPSFAVNHTFLYLYPRDT